MASESLHPFFSQVGAAKEENGILEFSAPIPLTKRKQLYVRVAYDVIYGAVVTREDATLPKYAVVTGTAGIDKSVFLCYFFWRMVKAKMRVFFLQKRHYFDGERMWEFQSVHNPTDRRFWTIDLWCLVDSADPTKMRGLPYNDCSILLATTPRNDYLSEFQKLVPIPPVFYIPPWSLDELQSLPCIQIMQVHGRIAL
jgi:hypothetical protein